MGADVRQTLTSTKPPNGADHTALQLVATNRNSWSRSAGIGGRDHRNAQLPFGHRIRELLFVGQCMVKRPLQWIRKAVNTIICLAQAWRSTIGTKLMNGCTIRLLGNRNVLRPSRPNSMELLCSDSSFMLASPKPQAVLSSGGSACICHA